MKRLNIVVVAVSLVFGSVLNHADAQRRGGGGMRGGGGARGGGGMSRGGGGMSRGGARSSVTRPSGGFSRPSGSAPRPSNPVANRPSGGQAGNRPNLNPSGNLGSRGTDLANRPGNRPAGDRGSIGNGNIGDGNIGNRPSNRPAGDRGNIGNGNTSNRPINIQDNDIVAGGGHWDYGHGCCYGWGAAAAGFVAGAAIGSMVYALPPSCPAYVYGGVTYNHCGGAWYAPQFQGTETTYIVVEAPPGAPADTATSPPAPPPSAPPE